MPTTIDMFKQSILRKANESTTTIHRFFDDNAETVEAVAKAMAERFLKGGRLFAMGNGGSACDAEHVSVEFMHPIFEKRRALPSMSLSSQSALVTAIANDVDFSRIHCDQLNQLGQASDIALAITTSGMSANLIAALKTAKQIGMLTVVFNGKDGGRLADLPDFNLTVPSFSIHRIQEVHIVLLHILWDLVHLSLGDDDIV